MPFLAALGKALPYIQTAWSLYAQSKNKPKKEDYVPKGAAYTRYLDNLKSQTAESRVYHQRMRPELRQIGAQTQRGQRQVGYQVAKQKPGGGIEAQMRMGINQQALEAIGIASEKASIAQEQVNVKTGEQLLRIGVQEEFALQRYQRDKKRFTQQMFTSTVQAGINFANIAVQQNLTEAKSAAEAAANEAAAAAKLTKSYESAIADGLIPKDTKENDYLNAVATAGFENPDIFNKYQTNIQKSEETFQKDQQLEELEENSIIARDQAIEEMRTNPKKAQEIVDKYRQHFKGTDLQAVLKEKRSLTKGLAPDLTKPLDYEIEQAAAQNNIKEVKKLAKKVYLDPLSSPDYIGQVSKIEQEMIDYQQAILDERQDITDDIRDKKNEEIVLQSSIISLKETVARWAKTYKAKATPAESTVSALNKMTAQIGGKSIKITSERDKYVQKLLTTVDGIDVSKGMTLKDATGLKRAIAGIIRTAESSEIGAYGLPTPKILTNLEIQLIGRVDAMLKKMPYVDENVENNNPLGLAF